MTRKIGWNKSLTGQFNTQELTELHMQDAQTLIVRLRQSPGIVVLRALTELLGHEEEEKLRAVNADPNVNDLWQKVIVETFSADMWYMFALLKFLDE